ncbi:anti-sigma factor [Psychroserpens sp.]|uniref:anti-sigma factor n=1 Tax=Psychroserpens sp. TaxID=2020870 RepID=UPI001B19F82C|nr:anti-sigma factor [Psychroserpens sp.]MBO6607139.1 anti-sigma factor [Psychroserpens sp.]MBO6632260.1 anti-sigma factor [Psychroserpens sp.]MBO6654285.1 anti-sigma factor [Psychroserpens sp.]MBO6682429.1 anti-sigma factor [Psychroserpens sp.]MBO6750911.1 anti-sigma factor [Psychroserpens sp.]
MDKTYILDNNLITRYVIGDLDSNERIQVEEAFVTHPELKDELNRIESSLEALAIDNAIDAPAKVKDDLLSAIKSKSEVKTIALPKSNALRPYLNIAASLAILLTASTVYLFTQLNATKDQLEVVETENVELNNDIDALHNSLEEASKWYALVNNPNVAKYILKGNDLMPEAKVISYVNDTDKSVVINTAYLPKLDDDHDYQMWADVEGVMIDMGVINTETEMLAMTYIDHAESLNITIEPAGGNDHPTVSKLITNIYL